MLLNIFPKLSLKAIMPPPRYWRYSRSYHRIAILVAIQKSIQQILFLLVVLFNIYQCMAQYFQSSIFINSINCSCLVDEFSFFFDFYGLKFQFNWSSISFFRTPLTEMILDCCSFQLKGVCSSFEDDFIHSFTFFSSQLPSMYVNPPQASCNLLLDLPFFLPRK